MKPLSKLFGLGRHGAADGQHAAVADQIARALSAAGLDATGGGLAVRATIDRALESAGLRATHPTPLPGGEETTRAHAKAARASNAQIDAAHGRFLHATFGNAHGRRDYRLYVPAGYDAKGAPRPLVVMLHGCTQTAEDFAAGTRMNALADRDGFLVAYPQQAGKANHAKCWNWFRPQDQGGDAGEPSVLAGIIEQVADGYAVDRARVFVAGLSAGAAMAVILGRTRPDLVRAIGAHSGLAYARAHDVPSALAAMQGRDASVRDGVAPATPVPTIIFHGDADRTVAPTNADALAADALPAALRVTHEKGRVTGGQSYTRQVAADDAGIRRFERWTVHGGGHAWSGGDRAGTYTDPAGPDASVAMVDFFLQQG